MSAEKLATLLDREMIESKGIVIAPSITPISALPVKDGADVSRELGGRLLVRYMLRNQVGQYSGGSAAEHYVTPTPYPSSGLVSTLALPAPLQRRQFALLLDPNAIAEIKGPRWVRFGSGIEYVLVRGFPPAAVASNWELQVR
jgi:hypothetical protein